jgi:hypothetical protein
MTTPLIPEVVFNLFQNEITKINTVFLTKVCETYNLNIEDVKKTLEKELKVSFTLNPQEKVIIVKKQKVPEDNERCIARIYRRKDLEVLQCTRRRHNDTTCDCCKLHGKMYHEGRLKYGLMTEPTPDELSPEVLSKKKLKKKVL